MHNILYFYHTQNTEVLLPLLICSNNDLDQLLLLKDNIIKARENICPLTDQLISYVQKRVYDLAQEIIHIYHNLYSTSVVCEVFQLPILIEAINESLLDNKSLIHSKFASLLKDLEILIEASFY